MAKKKPVVLSDEDRMMIFDDAAVFVSSLVDRLSAAYYQRDDDTLTRIWKALQSVERKEQERAALAE